MIILTWEELIAIVLFFLILAFIGGWTSFYYYSNYYYMHYPELFKARLEAKIAKKKEKQG